MFSRNILCFSVFGLASCICAQVCAYEVGSHARLTEQAYIRSVLGADANFLKRIDVETYISSNPVSPFDERYYDISGNNIRSRFADNYVVESNRMPDPKVNRLSAKGWLMRGAIREDDVPDYPPFNGDNPPDDPDNQIVRVFNHFYDPVNQTPLNVAGFTLGTDAPTWATGAEEAFGCPNCEDLNRRNHFTIRDARIAEWRALTGQDRNGNKNIGANGQQSDESVRKAYWATLFHSLGDVVHLVQDMAQPQHTRNEAHTPVILRLSFDDYFNKYSFRVQVI